MAIQLSKAVSLLLVVVVFVLSIQASSSIPFIVLHGSFLQLFVSIEGSFVAIELV